MDLKIWLELEIPVIEDGNSFGRRHTVITSHFSILT
jgi:hypothetical protein